MVGFGTRSLKSVAALGFVLTALTTGAWAIQKFAIERLLFQPWLESERSVPAPQLPEKRPERRLLLAQQPVAA